MKKLIIILLTVVSVGFSSCGVGNYSVTSGKEDEARIFVQASEEYPISLQIDDKVFDTKTVKKIDFKSKKDLGAMVNYGINTTPGTHKVVIKKDGVEVYNYTVFISTGEYKLIKL